MHVLLYRSSSRLFSVSVDMAFMILDGFLNAFGANTSLSYGDVGFMNGVDPNPFTLSSAEPW